MKAGWLRPPWAWSSQRRRWALWTALVLLVLLMLGTMGWLANRYESAQLQDALERDNTEALGEIRAAMGRNVQVLQSLHPEDSSPAQWRVAAELALRDHSEWVRLEWRNVDKSVVAAADSLYRNPVFDRLGRANQKIEVMLACNMAVRSNSAGYSPSGFIPMADGQGLEIMEMCLPIFRGGSLTGYLVASYALSDMLERMVSATHMRSQELSFIDADGTRLAVRGGLRRGRYGTTSQQILDLPGYALMLRIDSWRSFSPWFPNLLSSLVVALSLALVMVMLLLARDMRRRLRAENELAEALAFRKAMEDSLVTGLRARDVNGRITYVNPAFCEMVGFQPTELLGQGIPAPYWPPEMFDEYGQRQAWRLAGNAPPREGVESVFQRRSGERFPVLIFEAPLINAGGQQTGWMSAILDISAQRRSEELSRASFERLQATARLATVGEMASLLSHELNQPLAAIASYASGSQNLLPASGTAQAPWQQGLGQALQHIAEQAKRAGLVIKSVHDFVRRRHAAREAVLPLALLDSIMPLVRLQAHKLGVRVTLHCAGDLPAVWCDRTMVEQVLLNLARNAMQAMQELPITAPRELTLSVQCSDKSADAAPLLFQVTDGGTGISPDISAQLYTPFFTTKIEGMGLGLSLCRTVIEQHGGRLEHRPHTPCGTVFYFSLAQPLPALQPLPQS